MLISDEYREQNRLLHEDPKKHYGVAGKAYVNIIKDLYIKHDCDSVLDYGCGKGQMRDVLPRHNVQCYDPAIPEFSALPEPADLVLCLDVMEHIEPECLDEVLDHIRSLTQKACLMSVSVRKAKKTLPDGRNAHLIIEPVEWWLEKIISRFTLQGFERGDGFFWAVLTRGDCFNCGQMLREDYGATRNVCKRCLDA